MDPNTPHRVEAERWLGIAAKLLTARDFVGSRTFAIRAKESDPNNELADQILAVVDTVLGGEKRVNSSQHPDWYTVLQLPRLVRDPELIANHYRRLVLLLNPDGNRLPFADYALQMVVEAWTVLSDPSKKWIFDNELAVYLQRVENQQVQQQQQQQPVRVEAMRADVDPHFQSSAAAAAAGSSVAAASTVANNNNSQINTFQFFQPQPPPQPTVSMWQQQQHQQQQHQHEHHHTPNLNQNNQQHQMHQQHQSQGHNTNQLHQIEFMQPPQQAVPQHQQQQLPPQWQMRDPTPVKGVETNRGVGNGVGGESQSGVTVMRRGADVAAAPSRTVLTPTRTTPRPAPAPPQPVPVVAPVPVQPAPTPMPTPVVVAPARVESGVATTRVVDGNVGNVNVVNVNSNNNVDNVGVVLEASNNADPNTATATATGAANESNTSDGVVEEVESFWTSCPYCYYIYEYQKMYQDCTLRCQNCRRGFHALQIPNPPLIKEGGGVGGTDKEPSSFSCWGFFPLGFSTASWKKHNKMAKADVASNWVPFSPMFSCPVGNDVGNFQWFASNEDALVGPKGVGRPPASTPRVYISDDDFVSDPSDSSSSDIDWRRNPTSEKKKKKKKKKRKTIGRGRVGRPPKRTPGKVAAQYQSNQDSVTGRGVAGGGEDVEDGHEGTDIVVGLYARAKEDAGKNKKVTATLTKNQARRRVKNMGKLDLNVEFNNDGDEHAPTVSAVNGVEDGIENIGFFEGLDEFLSTLPILNGAGDEKVKPS